MVPGVRALIRPRFLVAAAVAGVAAGLIGIAMALLLELFESLFYGISHGGLLERLAAAPPWRRALAPALGGLVAGGLWWWLRATGGVADVESAVADRSGQAAPRMGLARPFLDAVTQVLTVGAGNSVGREGAPRLAAGAVAARLATRLGIARSEGAILIASAAGAGLAAMYNAPLGGAAYAVELDGVGGPSQRRVVHGRQAGPGGGGDEDRALAPGDPQAGGEPGRHRPGGQTRGALAAHRVARTDREDLGDGVEEGARQPHPGGRLTAAVRDRRLHIGHPAGGAQPPPQAAGDKAAQGRGERTPPRRGGGQALQEPAVGDAVEQ